MAKFGTRMSRAFLRVKQGLIQNAYLVTLGAAVAVIAASAMYTHQVRARQEQIMQAAAQAPEVQQTPSPAPRITPLPTIAPVSFTTYVPRIVTVRPVSGGVLRSFGAESVYWDTLSCFQPHEAADIEGAADEAVRCAMDGVVSQTTMDALWGWRVTVAHTDGSEGTYAGLALCYVSPGQSVTRGMELGTLLETVPCEAELGPHLHLEWKKNGEALDPMEMLPD